MHNQYSLLLQDYNDILKNYDLRFFNHGYSPVYNNLNSDTFLNKYGESLYLYALELIKTNGKSILDAGCGRGGGTITYSKYFNFKDIYGFDMNEESIQYAQSYNNKIQYSVQSFLNINYDKKFDIISNIDSSWYIKDYIGFYNIIKNILKDDGIYICLDFFNDIHQKDFENFTNKFKYVKIFDITKNVLDSCQEQIKYLMKDETVINKFLIKKYQDNYNMLNNNCKYLKYICSNKEII